MPIIFEHRLGKPDPGVDPDRTCDRQVIRERGESRDRVGTPSRTGRRRTRPSARCVPGQAPNPSEPLTSERCQGFPTPYQAGDAQAPGAGTSRARVENASDSTAIEAYVPPDLRRLPPFPPPQRPERVYAAVSFHQFDPWARPPGEIRRCRGCRGACSQACPDRPAQSTRQLSTSRGE